MTAPSHTLLVKRNNSNKIKGGGKQGKAIAKRLSSGKPQGMAKPAECCDERTHGGRTRINELVIYL